MAADSQLQGEATHSFLALQQALLSAAAAATMYLADIPVSPPTTASVVAMHQWRFTNLSSPATLFVPTNAALELSQAAHNVSAQQTEAYPLLPSALGYYIAPDEAIVNISSVQDDLVLTTMDPAGNLTVYQNGSQTFLDSYGAEAMIVTSPAYACNLIIYGINGAFEDPQTLPFNQQFLPYLRFLLMPGGAEVPPQLIIAAVAANETYAVAAAFNQVLAAGNAQELADLLQQGVTLPGGFEALAAVANAMIQQTSCSNLGPLIQALYKQLPDIQSLNLSPIQLARLQMANPQLVACILASIT